MVTQAPHPDPSPAPAFGGTIPKAYHEHLVPLLFREYADDLAERVGRLPRGALLETAAGTGVVSGRLSAMLAPDARMTVSDLSPDMLAVAKQSIGDSPRLTFVAADATALPFDAAMFDAVVCQFGVMFFPDEPLGYREAARVLRPRGRFLFNVWDDLEHNPLPACIHETFAALAPADPPRFLERPFRPLEATKILRNLQSAGFGEVRMTVLPRPCRVPSAAQAVDAILQSTPLGSQVADRAPAKAAIPGVRRALAERFAGGSDSTPFTVPMQAIVFEAIRSG